MKLVWHDQAWDDYHHWLNSDPKVFERLNELIRECRRTPFVGIGKPEPLKGDFKGWWSRRITAEDRLVYRLRGETGGQWLEIAQCRFHY